MSNSTYNKIFKNTNVFTDFFCQDNFVKKVLFPVPNYRLTEEQYIALKKTIDFLCLPQIIYEVVFEDGNRIIRHDLETETYTEYVKKSNSILECQLYSDCTFWGIGISHEDHAIIGCSAEFYQVFQSFYGKNDKDEFVAYWEANQKDFGSDIAWLVNLKDKLV